jgi:hypothetical protein
VIGGLDETEEGEIQEAKMGDRAGFRPAILPFLCP